MKDVSKALVFSDLHGRMKACAALLKAVERERPGLVIGLGDFLYNGPRNGVPGDYEPMECAKMLNGIDERKLFVRGNCDSRVDEMVLSDPILDNAAIELFGRRCGLFHGDAPSYAGLGRSKIDLFMFGHSHVYLLEKKDFASFLNPGSVGFPKGGNPATYAILEKDGISIRSLLDGTILLSRGWESI